MRKKVKITISILSLFLMFLISAGIALAQTNSVFFDGNSFSWRVSCSYNFQGASMGPSDLNNTQMLNLTMLKTPNDVLGVNSNGTTYYGYECSIAQVFNNGTEKSWVENSIDSFFGFLIFEPNLSVGEEAGNGIPVNQTIAQEYSSGLREINYCSVSNEYGIGYLSFDKQTGIVLEYVVISQSQGNFSSKLVNTNVWSVTDVSSPSVSPTPSVPEFPSILLLPLLMTTIALGTLLYRKKQLKFLK